MALRLYSLHPKNLPQRDSKARVCCQKRFTFRLFLLLVLIANYIATLFDLRAHFLRLFQDYRLLMREGEPNYTYNPFNLSRERLQYHQPRHFRLIAGADGLCGTH